MSTYYISAFFNTFRKAILIYLSTSTRNVSSYTECNVFFYYYLVSFAYRMSIYTSLASFMYLEKRCYLSCGAISPRHHCSSYTGYNGGFCNYLVFPLIVECPYTHVWLLLCIKRSDVIYSAVLSFKTPLFLPTLDMMVCFVIISCFF